MKKVIKLTERDLNRIVKKTLNEQTKTLGINNPGSLKRLKEYLRTYRDGGNTIDITIGDTTTELTFKGGGGNSDITYVETIPHEQLVSILPFVLGLTNK
jgi:hypothetical protein